MEDSQRINQDPFRVSESDARETARQMFAFLNPNNKPYLDEVEVLELLKLAYKGTSFENAMTIEDLASYMSYYGRESEDGRISYHEFEGMVVAILAGSRPQALKENKAMHSEQIKEDLKRQLSKIVGPEAVDDELSSAVRLFNTYDRNKSGYLEEHEIPQILIDTYEAMGLSYNPTEEDVRNYINMMDYDGDGRISRYEYEIFLLKALEQRGIKGDLI